MIKSLVWKKIVSLTDNDYSHYVLDFDLATLNDL